MPESGPSVDGEARYSPAEISDIHVSAISGDPSLDRAFASHIVKGRLKTSHLWAPQNQPVFRCV